LAAPTRPRPPGHRRSTYDKLVAQGPTVILAALAALLLAVAGMGLLIYSLSGGSSTEAGSGTGSGPRPDDATGEGAAATTRQLDPIELPLDLDSVGFEAGTVEPTADSEGPDAASYCNNAPAASGLSDWRGNRLTEDSGRRRVAQLVARFESSFDAAAYVAASSAIIDCEEWETTSGDGVLQFTVSEQTPATVFGDETRQFDLQASAEGPELFLRTLLVRSQNLVAQFTFVSANRQDLARIDELAEVATEQLGF
jgi:hypothetical protein